MTLADRLEAIGRGLWRPSLPADLRARLIAWVMTSAAGGPVARRLAHGVAVGGAAALETDPRTALALIAALQALGARPVLIAGDSHSRLYVQRDRRGAHWLLPLLHLATGASARGLAKATSRSGQGDALRTFLQTLSNLGARFPVVLVFGQVDVEFVFMFKRLVQDPPAVHDEQAFEGFCRETADSYVEFASGLPMRERLALAAIFPPALSDNSWREGYLNAHIADRHAKLDIETLQGRLRMARIDSLAVRTTQHAAFNARLAAAARARQLAWVDAFHGLLGPDGCAGPDRLGRGAGIDHHLDADAVRPVIVDRLWTLVDHLAQT